MTNKTKTSPQALFISVEGGEGAGKSTLIEQYVLTLRARGIDFVVTREPGGTVLGDQIRSWLLNADKSIKIGDKAELLLFLAARAQHIEEVITPALKAGKVVVCDRFNDSTIAYQGAGRHLGVEWVRDLCLKVCGPVVPDLTLYLDVDPTIGLQRTRRTSKATALAGEVDRIEAEKNDFHERVRQAFISFSEEEPRRFCVIDANQAQRQVIERAKEVLEHALLTSGCVR